MGLSRIAILLLLLTSLYGQNEFGPSTSPVNTGVIQCGGVNDSAVVQIAASNSGTYHFPANKTCVIGNIASFASNVTWIGQNTTFKHLSTDTANYMLSITFAGPVDISGFNFDINGVLQSTANTYLIYTQSATVHFHNNTYLNSGTSQSTMGGMIHYQSDVQVDHNYFQNTVLGVDNEFSSCPSGYHCQFTDNDIVGSTTNGVYAHDSASGSQQLIAHNTIRSVAATSCPGSTGQCGNGVLIFENSGQTIVDANTVDSPGYSGVRNNNSPHAVISDNTINNAGEDAIWCGEIGAYGAICTGNTVTNSLGGIIETNPENRAQNNPNIIVGNHVFNARGGCYFIQNALFNGNDCANSAIGVQVGNGAYGWGNILSNNSFSGVGLPYAISKDMTNSYPAGLPFSHGSVPPISQISVTNYQEDAVKTAIATANNAPFTFSGATNANPMVITQSGGSLPTAGNVLILYWFYGMTQANGQLCTVASPSGSTFQCSNLNSTSWGTWVANPGVGNLSSGLLVYSSGTTPAYSLPSVVSVLN